MGSPVISRRHLANAIRALSMDAVQRANSGHPGAPMGMADIAEVLWNSFIKHNPQNPQWPNRDRFVLSNGHGSMLLYSLLHLTGYDISIDDLKNFRQLHSKTPGHPEFGHAPGVETTTGPLGQGLANGVGMAIAERALASQFNREENNIVDHHTYVFIGDGCLMEGISHEVCSLAGTLELGKLIVIYDDNGISIDGDVKGWFTEDITKRFEAYGWHVIEKIDGHDASQIQNAITDAKLNTKSPTLICCRTKIGFGAPNKQDSAAAHGAPLGEAEIAGARENLNWPHEPFVIPQEIYNSWSANESGATAEAKWQEEFEKYRQTYPELATQLERRISGQLPEEFPQRVIDFAKQQQAESKSVATRKSSQMCLEDFSPLLPEMMGGSADLTGSNNTNWSGSKALTATEGGGNYIYYGVREFGMSAIMNGIALHGGFIPYSGTFLMFMEYARNAIRMAALMKQRVIHVYTHDSIGLGEDGPTHQAVEQLVALRSTPNMSVWRPCDTVETAFSWQSAIENNEGPTALILSRQSLPVISRDDNQFQNISRGGYIIWEPQAAPVIIIISTGSEVGISLAAAEELSEQGLATRVVSMPSTDRFDAQDEAYRETVLPASIRARVAVEASFADYWSRYVGLDGKVVGMRSFGESAPGDELMRHFGFTTQNIIDTARNLI